MVVYAIIGTRSFIDYEVFKAVMNRYEVPERIVSGGATGADSLAERWSKENNIPITIHYAEWSKYGTRAGPIRNQLIVNELDVRQGDSVIAFWDGISKGTLCTIKMAEKLKIPVHVINYLDLEKK